MHRIALCLQDAAVASVLVGPGETAPTLVDLGFEPANLARVIYLSDLRLAPGADRQAAVALLSYAALRRGRLWHRTQVAAMLDAGSDLGDLLALQALAPAGEAATGTLPRSPCAQRIDYAIQRASERSRALGRAVCAPYLLGELEERLDEYVESIWRTKFYRATMDRLLGRQQYVYALSQKYQFVRFTTRLLGHAIAHSPTTELRSHFIRHLKGEVNHELIIEKDLAALGADVDYVRERMAPNMRTRQFMSAQESAVAFHHDPLLMMAAPLAAEVITAKLPEDFFVALHDCARSWGVERPEKVTQFLTSHVHADGSDDGHLAGTLAALAPRFESEAKLQEFLGVLELCMDAFRSGYDALLDEVAIWTRARPVAREGAVAAE